ncbi:MAG: tetratricopeptide repeat protein [Candidatus Thermoplasmatota archaeon]
MRKGREKILLHLHDVEKNYIDDKSSFSYFPFVLCQEGISYVVEISRNRVSKILKELENKKSVRKESKRVLKGEQKRFVYFLTEKGEEKVEEIKEEIGAKKISVRTEEGVFKTELSDIDEYLEGAGNLVFALNNLDKSGELDLQEMGNSEYFVNREEEKELLKEKIDLIKKGKNEEENFLLLTGPAGVGKTRLVEEIRSQTEKDQIAFLEGKCYQDNIEPYGPLYRGVSTYFEGSKELESEESKILDLLDARSGKGQDNETKTSREKSMFFHDIAEGLKTLSDKIPMVFFFDDLRWADKTTLELFLHLAENLEGGSIQFIGAYRGEEIESEEKIEILDGLKDTERCTVKELKPFDWKDTRNLVSERIGRKMVPDDFIDICHHISDGLPLFIEAYLDEILRTGALDPIAGRYPTSEEKIDFPSRIMDLYHQKLEPLDEEEREILDICSCFKKEIPMDLIVELTGDGEEDVKTRIEELEEADLLEMDLNMDVNFSHDLMRMAVNKDMEGERKQDIHRKIADTLVEFFEDGLEGHYSELGRHHEEGEMYDQAVKYYKKAAEKAEESYANEKALQLYKKLLRVQEEVPDVGLSRSHLFEKLGDLEKRMGELKKGEKYLRKALEEAESWRETQRLKRKVSECLRKRGEYDQAIEFMNDSLSIIKENAAGEDLKRERSKTLKEKGIIKMRKNEFDSSEQIFKEIKESCEECDTDEMGTEREEIEAVRGEALHYLGSIEYYRSDFEKAERYLQEAIEVRKKVGDLFGLADSNNNLGVIYRHKQEYDSALRYFKEANSWKKEAGMKEGDPGALDNIGIIYYDKGELDKALEYHKKCLYIEKKMGDKNGIAATFDNIGIILFEKGKLDESIDNFKRSLQLKNELEDKNGLALSHYNLARSYKEKGELNRAIDHLEDSLEIRKDKGLKQQEGESELEMGIIYVEKGGLEKAVERLNRALDIFKEIGNEYGMGMTLSHLGKLHLLKGKMKKAKLYLNHSKNIGFGFEDIKYSIINNRHLAELYLEDGDSEKAHEYIQEGLEESLEMGAKNQIGKCRHVKGNIYYKNDHWYQADKGYRRALDIFEEVGNDKEKAKVLFDWSLMLKKIGEKEDAANNLERAIELFESCRMENWCSSTKSVSPGSILEELEER